MPGADFITDYRHFHLAFSDHHIQQSSFVIQEQVVRQSIAQLPLAGP
ncbi:hypothetical protein PS723_00172 [Pseudomonas fluorescens]|uniref:Uncharacterized protein n=1 Tax=Pseudomonas fluorescens TaxID=294 RepID=A0A5E6ZLT9_PSEFL|nr:hypothetical protein PS723_00172 [Pseudomonas fluorescens]